MKCEVLVIDDEAQVRELVIEFLREHGYQAESAEDGEIGLELALELRPRIILLDIKMPGVGGVETLKRLRELLPHAAVIMMSGYAEHATALESLMCGAHDFIEKPFDLEYLERVLAVKMATA